MTEGYVNGYKLSERAAMAQLGFRPADKPALTVSPMAVAGAKHKPAGAPSPLAMDAQTVFAPYKFPDGAYSDDVAMDSCLPVASASAWALQSAYHEGQGFFGYPYLAQLVQRAEYRHACEIWAEHAVRKWIKLVGGTDETRKAIEEELERLNVRDTFQQWILHDHIYGRGQMFLDFGDADDEVELAVPLAVTDKKVSPARPLQRLTVVEPMWSAPLAYVTNNPLRHDFYKPQHWSVFTKRVDRSRLLTITSRPVSDMLKPAYAFGGQSLIQLMKPYVDNWLQERQDVADMVHTYSVMVLATDMSSITGGGNGEALFRRLDVFNSLRDNRGSMAIDKGNEELTNVAVPLAGLSDLLGQAQEQLASVSRIPLSIYLQITPTGLNATSDGETRNFYADVKAYQEKNVRPALQVVLQLAQLSKLGTIDPTIKIDFVDLWEMSDKDKAEIRKADGEIDVAYVNAGLVSPDEARERITNDETGLYHGVDLSDPAPDSGNDDDEPGGDNQKDEES